MKIRASHFLALSNIGDAAALHKQGQAHVFAIPILLYSKVQSYASITALNGLSHYSLLGSASPLPPSLSLVTLQDLGLGKILLRLAHLYEVGEDKMLSQPATVDLASLLPSIKITDVLETQLTGFFI